MTRVIHALGTVNPWLLVALLAAIFGAGFHVYREWSTAAEEAQAEQDEIDREYSELLDSHGRGRL